MSCWVKTSFRLEATRVWIDESEVWEEESGWKNKGAHLGMQRTSSTMRLRETPKEASTSGEERGQRADCSQVLSSIANRKGRTERGMEKVASQPRAWLT